MRRGRYVRVDRRDGRKRPDRDRAPVGSKTHGRCGGRCRGTGTGDVRPWPMITLSASTRIYLACGATGIRKGFDGIAVLVPPVMDKASHSGPSAETRRVRKECVSQ